DRVAACQAKLARRLVKAARQLIQLGRSAARGPQLDADVARELGELRARERLAEEKACDLGQLVRLVEDYGVARGQQLGDAFLPQHEVGEEEVVVDDDHVRRQGIAARAHDEAIAIVGTGLAKAVVTGRSRMRPDRRVFRYFGKVGPIARGRARGEALNEAKLP